MFKRCWSICFENKNEIYNQMNCHDLCFELKYLEISKCNCKSRSLGDVWELGYLFQNDLNIKECTFESKIDFYFIYFYKWF